MPLKNSIPSLPFAESVAGGMADGLELMKKLWGVAGLPTMPGLPTPGNVKQFAQGLPGALPNMIAPTFDVAELDKRIADLRAVEQWLALNANMLRATIQTLEVQRNTIATLKSFSGAMMASATNSMNSAAESLANAQAKTAAAKSETAAKPAEPAADAAAQAAAAPAAAASSGKANSNPEFPLNATAWWGMLQDQFTRLASAAAASTSATPSAKQAAAKSVAAKKVARKSSRPRKSKTSGSN